MNDWDKNNLMFIMKLSRKELAEWFMESSEDDRLYAEELLARAHILLGIEEVEICDDPENLSDAKSVLKQFTLTGKVK